MTSVEAIVEETIAEKNVEKIIELPKDEEMNEYSYLERGGFSSENFKIEIRGLPKFYGINELKKLFGQKLKLSHGKIKPPHRGAHWVYVCFQNQEDRAAAILALNGYLWKGKTLQAMEAQPTPDPLMRKRKQDENGGGRNQKKPKEEDEKKSQEERLKDSTTPYWNLPYDEQVILKGKEVREIIRKMDNELWKTYPNLRTQIEKRRKLHNGLTCELLPMKTAAKTEGYRNKCEFTVGIDEETGLPTVGFRLGSYVTGCVGVAPIAPLSHISDNMKKAVLLFEEFVRASDQKPYSPIDYTGFWRQMTTRQSNATGDVMLVIGVHPQDISEADQDKIKQKLIEHFSSERAKECCITSLYYQLLTKRRSGEDPMKASHLWGSTHITETILGLNFRISPEAFFQVNTAGAEMLYQSAIDLSCPKEDSTVIDICCGTGTIGLCFAKHCKQVLGLELIEEAVKDAKANAELNAINNCSFFAGRAEEILPSVLSRSICDDVVAIIDPPRAGLHMRAVTMIRNNRRVNRLVYISCNPSAAMKNFVDLCRPTSKTLHGNPFIAQRAVSVDMFPQTRHIEVAVLFERVLDEVKEEDSEKEVTEKEETQEDPELTNYSENEKSCDYDNKNTNIDEV